MSTMWKPQKAPQLGESFEAYQQRLIDNDCYFRCPKCNRARHAEQFRGQSEECDICQEG